MKNIVLFLCISVGFSTNLLSKNKQVCNNYNIENKDTSYIVYGYYSIIEGGFKIVINTLIDGKDNIKKLQGTFDYNEDQYKEYIFEIFDKKIKKGWSDIIYFVETKEFEGFETTFYKFSFSKKNEKKENTSLIKNYCLSFRKIEASYFIDIKTRYIQIQLSGITSEGTDFMANPEGYVFNDTISVDNMQLRMEKIFSKTYSKSGLVYDGYTIEPYYYKGDSVNRYKYTFICK